MTQLLEIREKIKLVYSKYETFILPLAKFLLAFIVLLSLNSRLGFMGRLDNMALVLIVALMCSFLPTGCIVLFAMLFSLLHMYALAMEAALVGLCLYLVMFLLFFRFSPKDSLVVVLIPLLFFLHVPYVIPIAVGLVCGPASIISVGCGVAVHYLLQTIVDSAAALKTMDDEQAMAKVRLLIDGIIGNREMMVMIAAFAITVLVVYLIRRLSIDYAWTIAMVSGVLIDVMILLIGDLIYDINISVGSALLGSLFAVAVAKVIEFFRFCVDYSRTEKVQFEDDEYYYYVKAVPKMTVAMSTKTVKKINSQHAWNGSVSGRETEGSYQSVETPSQSRSTGRRVTTERTAAGRGGYSTTRGARRGDRRGGKSVTIGSASQESDLDDFLEDFDEEI